MEKKKKNCGR
jgi:hypothetical protein